jgi:TatA/E family protein of Tat protein translocase
MAPLFAFLGEFSLMHWLVVLGIGILLFGKRLPEITRSLGKSLVAFKKRPGPHRAARYDDPPLPGFTNLRCELCQRENVIKAPGMLAEHIRCECGRPVCPRHICHKRCDSCGKVMCGGCVQVFYRELPGAGDSLGRPKSRREILHYCPACYKAA